VCHYLLGKGYVVLDRNWRIGHLEVDVIAMASDGVHFVEVKSRTAPAAAPPEMNAGKRKMQRVAKAAVAWMAEHRELSGNEIWLDVAAVMFDGGSVDISYYPGAYVPIYV